jgi:D-methionine transport system ATP-binding protein
MVNHQLDFLEEFAERVIYLEAGKIGSDCLAHQLDWLGLKTQLIDLEKSRQSDNW